jgi:hypothetical protein
VTDTIAEGIERERTDETLARLNRALRTVNECNLALVRASEEYELLRSVCRISSRWAAFEWPGSVTASLTNTKPCGQSRMRGSRPDTSG